MKSEIQAARLPGKSWKHDELDEMDMHVPAALLAGWMVFFN